MGPFWPVQFWNLSFTSNQYPQSSPSVSEAVVSAEIKVMRAKMVKRGTPCSLELSCCGYYISLFKFPHRNRRFFQNQTGSYVSNSSLPPPKLPHQHLFQSQQQLALFSTLVFNCVSRVIFINDKRLRPPVSNLGVDPTKCVATHAVAKSEFRYFCFYISLKLSLF